MNAIAQIRRFNRTVTQQIGALEEHFLGRDRSLGASRLLFEIGANGMEVRQLRARLSLDSGYTSRLLRGLESEGLIRTARSSGDARVRCVKLTPAGRKELAARFETGFDPARSIPLAATDLTPPQGFFVVATLNGEAVGCGALKCHPDCGEIKRMWVAPPSRGLGIGKRILQRLEALARKRRLPLLRLETNKALTEAQALYRSSGYREVRPFNDEPYAHHWFEKAL